MAPRTRLVPADNSVQPPDFADRNYQAMLLNNIREAMVVWDLNGRITFWNPAAYLLYGWTASERLGLDVQRAYYSMFTPSVIQPGEENTGGFEIERQCVTKRGERIWVSARTTALRETWGSRQIIGYMDLARNITRSKREQQQLKESQHFVQRILDTSPAFIYIIEVQTGRILFVSNEVHSIFGQSVEAFLSMEKDQVQELIHPVDLACVVKTIEESPALPDGQVFEAEVRLKTREDVWRWFHSRNTVFQKTQDGCSYQIIGSAQDITERKRTEEALQRRLATERLIAAVATQMNRHDPNREEPGIGDSISALGDFIGADFSFAILYPSPSQIDSAPLTWFCGQDHRQSRMAQKNYLAHLPMLLKEFGETGYYRVFAVEEIPSEALELKELLAGNLMRSCLVVKLSHGAETIGAIGFGARGRKNWEDEDLPLLKTLSDIITNALVHRRSTIALYESEARYRAIVEDHQTEMICRALPDGTLTFVNEAYCRYYGRKREELIGSSIMAGIPPEDREMVQAKFARLSLKHPTETYENRVQFPNGVLRWHEWTDRAIFDPQGAYIEFQSVGRDITERKEMEAQIRSAQAQLADQSRLAAIGELAASVAHQISNPLTTIIGEAQYVNQQTGSDDPHRDSIEAIEKAGWRAQKVVQELLEFSQPGSDTLEPVNVNQTIKQAVLLVGAHIEAIGVQLKLDLAQKLPRVRGNLRQFENLWVNLLLITRATPANGKPHSILVRSLVSDTDQVAVEVLDDGKFIPPEELETIFEPGLSPSGEGNGMELSICREIVRQNRGSISAQSSTQGTTFKILLPGED